MSRRFRYGGDVQEMADILDVRDEGMREIVTYVVGRLIVERDHVSEQVVLRVAMAVDLPQSVGEERGKVPGETAIQGIHVRIPAYGNLLNPATTSIIG